MPYLCSVWLPTFSQGRLFLCNHKLKNLRHQKTEFLSYIGRALALLSAISSNPRSILYFPTHWLLLIKKWQTSYKHLLPWMSDLSKSRVTCHFLSLNTAKVSMLYNTQATFSPDPFLSLEVKRNTHLSFSHLLPAACIKPHSKRIWSSSERTSTCFSSFNE